MSTATRSAVAVIPLILISATLVQEGTTFQAPVVLPLVQMRHIQISQPYTALPVHFFA